MKKEINPIPAALIVLMLAIQIVRADTSLAKGTDTILIVTLDGSGDYTSIQAAIDDTRSFPDQPITIYIKAGVYNEKVTVHQWNPRVTLKGEGADKTIIRWGDYFDKIGRGRNSTFMTATLSVQARDFRAEDLTIENTAGPVGQAIALSVTTDGCQFYRCRILGNQDTLFVDGKNARQYFADCYIEGTTDFIFGGSMAFFERCEIHSKSNSYITAASTPQYQRTGLVFYECKLTASDGVESVYLGRPWRQYARTAFLKCELGAHIRPKGWHDWSDPQRRETALYAEYQNTGPGANTSGRVGWMHLLSDESAGWYSRRDVLLGGCDTRMEVD